jgi:hypothetical protein
MRTLLCCTGCAADDNGTVWWTSDRWVAIGLLVLAVVAAFFVVPYYILAIRGPRPITEDELLAIDEPPGLWDRYVRFEVARPKHVINRFAGGLVVPGQKINWQHLLLPVGDRYMECTADLKHDSPVYVGFLEPSGANDVKVFGASALKQPLALRPFGGQEAPPRKVPTIRVTMMVDPYWVGTNLGTVFIICALVGAFLISGAGAYLGRMFAFFPRTIEPADAEAPAPTRPTWFPPIPGGHNPLPGANAARNRPQPVPKGHCQCGRWARLYCAGCKEMYCELCCHKIISYYTARGGHIGQIERQKSTRLCCTKCGSDLSQKWGWWELLALGLALLGTNCIVTWVYWSEHGGPPNIHILTDCFLLMAWLGWGVLGLLLVLYACLFWKPDV